MALRIHIAIRGAVQGVGFRPFIMRLATEMQLAGYVLNSSKGVFIEAEGDKSQLDLFVDRIGEEKPQISFITNLEYSYLDPVGYIKFEIMESRKEYEKSALILPDISICPDCLKEMFDPINRRYLYPFINCTNCGPRYSIIESLPYDRANTSMKKFQICPNCRDEYENPADRRYHAQPVACPVCGPNIELVDNTGKMISKNQEAIIEFCRLILYGKIIALKGLGGFQLIADARNYDVVMQLRKRKNREEKPFAVMLPDINSVKSVCYVSKLEERLLLSPESPIVLLKKKVNTENILSELIAIDNPYLGVMLPYTPLHHLIMKELQIPVIATSGNISEEPMCIDNDEAIKRLGHIADYFLMHNRPIVRHVDDSIVRIVLDREMVLRRARGYAPLPIELSDVKGNVDKKKVMLAVGGHLKNSIAVKSENNVFISQHIGDLSTNEAYSTFKKVISDLQELYAVKPEQIICDLHPDYLSTKYAVDSGISVMKIQHHIAHVASCRAENRVKGSALGVAWDGTGFGLDGTIWGGEFFISDDNSIAHIAQMRQFPLPGGEQAIKEPRRSALGMLYEIFGDDLFENSKIDILKKFSQQEINILSNMIKKKINSTMTSSVGRIFDAVASILNLAQKSNFEGQAAMAVEFIADINEQSRYTFDILNKEIQIIDWQPIIEQIFNDLSNNVANPAISAKFHNTLANIILAIAKNNNMYKVILSGGCFQNVVLLEKTVKLLEGNDLKVYWHQRIPPNDGGIALGQIAAAHYGY